VQALLTLRGKNHAYKILYHGLSVSKMILFSVSAGGGSVLGDLDTLFFGKGFLAGWSTFQSTKGDRVRRQQR